MNNTTQTDQNQYDVIIAGGGLSGTLSALGLASQTKADGSPLSIAIIEANDIQQTPKLTFDSRVLALSHGSVEYLKSLNVWQDIAPHAATIKNIHISDRGYYGKARLTAKDHQVSALGYVVEMSVLGQAFLSKLTQLQSLQKASEITSTKPLKSVTANITWFCPDHITGINWQQDSVKVNLNSSQQLSAKLLLACDGGQSTCRQFANIASTTKSYEQCALIANVSMAKAHQDIAFERFTESGPIAVLPLTDSGKESHKCSLVWTLTPEQAAKLVALDETQFKLELELAFGSWLGKVEKVGERVMYPLNLVQANEQVYHRMALIGNASHTIHPIAGQGFNLGLRDVQQLCDCIAFNIRQNLDIADFSALMRYANARKADHQQVIKLTDSLVTLFSNDLPPLVAGRNIGLKVLNYCTPLKNCLVNKTMGY
ncbi:2-octaprenyl-6-methoxyphenyl hydroxylase [Colwellia sp. 1_MG-2023]|uniref:2-octaprenyl-6-methoxyphenyl hydroxylase n=1 Tax=Colwellia sp. 1_MG-2023 TaxID=3062649 RepID=UPI0026E27D66|nr:2-octaprenyl-6-methoxyphenyl hydroxylase [Colwellia sp. 1_MG-2023]MDO6445878.1 2-octaprenyl-6-methoxyphenyl hydroxylase [Colwellia sp. 1_MG-2023]